MFNELKKIISSISGSLLMIGIDDDKIQTLANNNEKISYFDILTKNEKSKGFGFGKNKTINIRKLKNKYKPKSLDYILVDYDSIKKYIRFFVRDSVSINAKELYIIGKVESVDVQLIEKRYSRYNVKITKKVIDKDIIITIDNTKSKNKIIMDSWYLVKDTLFIAVDAIGDLLAS